MTASCYDMNKNVINTTFEYPEGQSVEIKNVNGLLCRYTPPTCLHDLSPAHEASGGTMAHVRLAVCRPCWDPPATFKNSSKTSLLVLLILTPLKQRGGFSQAPWWGGGGVGLGWVGSRPRLVAYPRSAPPSLRDPTGRPYPGVRSQGLPDC